MTRDYALDFILYSYFEVTTDTTEDDIIIAAIKRAYRDATNRVVSFADEKESWNIRKKVVLNVKKSVDKVLKDWEYREFHKDTCVWLKDNVNDFSYGKAQKLVNMTMKYLCVIYSILGEKENTKQHYKRINQLEKELDIPVDSYILESASKKKEDGQYKYGFSIEVPNKDYIMIKGDRIEIGGKGNYNVDKSLAWSKWNSYEEYLNFQTEVKEQVEKMGELSSIEWENLAWIEVARKRKEKENKNKENKYRD